MQSVNKNRKNYMFHQLNQKSIETASSTHYSDQYELALQL